MNRATNIDRNFDRSKAQGGRWQHDASHRQGVAYRDNATREKFDATTLPARMGAAISAASTGRVRPSGRR